MDVNVGCLCIIWKLFAAPLSYDVGPAVHLPPDTVLFGVERMADIVKMNRSPTLTLTVKF